MAKNIFSWSDWQPGLNNSHFLLKDVYNSIPGHNDQDIAFHVKLFENPKSPLAFDGAISLSDHDCIHILLGRGLLNQDEGFVIGFTMGTTNINFFQCFLFKIIASNIYPKPYKFSKNDLKSFMLGYNYGKKLRKRKDCIDIHEKRLCTEKYLNMSIKDIRQEFGIKESELRAIYNKEKIIIPNTKASRRLPLKKDITMTRLNDIDGEYCNWYD